MAVPFTVLTSPEKCLEVYCSLFSFKLPTNSCIPHGFDWLVKYKVPDVTLPLRLKQPEKLFSATVDFPVLEIEKLKV